MYIELNGYNFKFWGQAPDIGISDLSEIYFCLQEGFIPLPLVPGFLERHLLKPGG